MVLPFADILGLGENPSSFGTSLALLITFVGIGVIVTVLIGYVLASVMGERRENQERQRRMGP
jgi:hypothetical protein